MLIHVSLHRHDRRHRLNSVPQILQTQVLVFGMLVVIVVSNRHSHRYRGQVSRNNR